MDIKVDAMSSAIAGMARDDERVSKAAQKIGAVTANAERDLAIAAARRESAAAIPPVVDRAVIVADGDIISPLVSLLQAKTSYAAEAKVAKVTSDIEQQAVDRLGRRSA